MGVTVRAAAETIVKTAATTSDGESTALTRTPGTPASAAPVTNLLWSPGGKRGVIVPALALSRLVETTDVAVAGVEKK